jgi:sugar lactone lactonase YvrE
MTVLSDKGLGSFEGFELLASGFGAVEGPTIDDAGNLYFCDLYKGGVYRLAPDGSQEEVFPRRRYIGGLCLHADGGIIMSGRDVSHLRNGELRILLDRDAVPGAGPMAGYGDIHADAAGRLFVGTVRRGPDGQAVSGEVVMLTQPAEATILYGDVALSNGIAASADGAHLYHSDTDSKQINVSRLQDVEVPVWERSFSTAHLPGRPDGMATDEEGGIWVAFYEGGQVVRFTPDGDVDRLLQTPADSPLSVCFAGDNQSQLIVATMDNKLQPSLGASIFRVDVGVRGANVGRARL